MATPSPLLHDLIIIILPTHYLRDKIDNEALGEEFSKGELEDNQFFHKMRENLRVGDIFATDDLLDKGEKEREVREEQKE